MDLVDAMTLTLELARQNELTFREIDSDELARECLRQHEALDQVEDFIVNHLGDD